MLAGIIIGFEVAYSFAKTPLKAAHAPLAMANTSHEEDLDFVLDMLSCVRIFDKRSNVPEG